MRRVSVRMAAIETTRTTTTTDITIEIIEIIEIIERVGVAVAIEVQVPMVLVMEIETTTNTVRSSTSPEVVLVPTTTIEMVIMMVAMRGMIDSLISREEGVVGILLVGLVVEMTSSSSSSMLSTSMRRMISTMMRRAMSGRLAVGRMYQQRLAVVVSRQMRRIRDGVREVEGVVETTRIRRDTTRRTASL